MNLPNLLTLSRIALSFLLILCLRIPGPAAKIAALIVFVIAAFTDLWDGRIARRRGLISHFGVLMDPIADKALVLSAFFCFVKLQIAPAWMVVLIAAREIGITALRLLALAKGRALAAETAGKVKAASQMTAISLTLLFLIARELVPEPWAWTRMGILALLFLTVLLTLTSGFSFLWNNRRAIFG